MVKPVVNKYINTIHSSTNHTPKEAHDDNNSAYALANLTMKSLNTIKYKNISVGDEVQSTVNVKDIIHRGRKHTAYGQTVHTML